MEAEKAVVVEEFEFPLLLDLPSMLVEHSTASGSPIVECMLIVQTVLLTACYMLPDFGGMDLIAASTCCSFRL